MPGTFIFRPIEANLTHDTDWLGKMDPYCAYMINNKRIKGQVCKSGGQHPIWNDSTTVPMEVDQPACVVELMDKDKFIDDSIGTFVVDLTEVQNYGTVSKWYPVFHKNKPAGQILFEAAYQPAAGLAQNVQVIQPVIKETVVVEEVPKRAMIEETVIQKEVPTTTTTETFGQSSFISKGGVIPVGSTNLDGGLYGKVVHMEPVSHVRDATGHGLHQEQLPRTQLGGPLSGSLGGGVLGSRELVGNELIGGTTQHVSTFRETEYQTSQIPATNFQGSQFQGSQLGGNQYLGNQPLNTQNLGNQYAGSNLPTNFNSTSISNAQLGGGAPLYKETANHPTTNTNKLSNAKNLGQEGNIIPGDLVGGHTQTNQSFGDRNPL